MSKKPIIVFEGIECSGKSYHSNNVANYLKKKSVKFLNIITMASLWALDKGIATF